MKGQHKMWRRNTRITITNAHALAPTDTLVLTTGQHISQEQGDALKAKIRELLPNPVVIIGAAWDISIVPAEANR